MLAKIGDGRLRPVGLLAPVVHQRVEVLSLYQTKRTLAFEPAFDSIRAMWKVWFLYTSCG